jgi:hypothetical protein
MLARRGLGRRGKDGSGSFSASFSPPGNLMPQIVPDAWYSFQPEPTT